MCWCPPRSGAPRCRGAPREVVRMSSAARIRSEGRTRKAGPSRRAPISALLRRARGAARHSGRPRIDMLLALEGYHHAQRLPRVGSGRSRRWRRQRRKHEQPLTPMGPAKGTIISVVVPPTDLSSPFGGPVVPHGSRMGSAGAARQAHCPALAPARPTRPFQCARRDKFIVPPHYHRRRPQPPLATGTGAGRTRRGTPACARPAPSRGRGRPQRQSAVGEPCRPSATRL